jgi:hypothetical protein
MSQCKTHHQAIFDSTGLLPGKSWKAAVVHMLLLLLVVFLTEISSARADGLFDFQMKLAEKGNAEAQFKIGEMYETGFGVKRDMKLANEWISKAAGQGHEVAKFKLLFWDMKQNGLTKSNKADYDALVASAKNENGFAQFYLGKLYADGAGVVKDSDAALDWFNKATLQGIVEAERESTAVREQQQREQLARRRSEQKREAELRAQQEEARMKQEANRLAAQKKAEAERAARLSDDKRKQAETTARDEKKAEAEEKARKAAAREAEQREREARRQAILEQREEREEERKAEFESDPCSGKSARFLSTCR